MTRTHAEPRNMVRGNVRILSLGEDADLLESRQRVLESMGYRVRSVSSQGIVEDEDVRGVDLALICHSVAAERAAVLPVALRRANPDVLLLKLSIWDAKVPDGYDLLLTCPSPGVLLATVDRMFSARFARRLLD